jgi:hypothetical protein
MEPEIQPAEVSKDSPECLKEQDSSTTLTGGVVKPSENEMSQFTIEEDEQEDARSWLQHRLKFFHQKNKLVILADNPHVLYNRHEIRHNQERKSLSQKIIDTLHPSLQLPLVIIGGAGVTAGTTYLLIRHVQHLIATGKVRHIALLNSTQ